jgi:hypothetical protein
MLAAHEIDAKSAAEPEPQPVAKPPSSDLPASSARQSLESNATASTVAASGSTTVVPSAEPVSGPTFGAGMLKGRKGRSKRDAIPATDAPLVAEASAVAATSSTAASPTAFGAGMLSARNNRTGWVVAIVLALAAVTVGYLATRGGSGAGQPTAAATQNK